MSVKKTCFVLLVLLLGVLFTGTYGYAAIASSLSIGEGYVNYGRAKDVYSLPDKDSDIISALAVGEPCDILSISGDWIEIIVFLIMKMYSGAKSLIFTPLYYNLLHKYCNSIIHRIIQSIIFRILIH